MRDLLEAVAAGELSPAAAEARLSGYATTGAGRFDAGRESRAGIPEGVLADGKTPTETASMTATAVETTGHALVTRTTPAHVTAIREAVPSDASLDVDDRARTVVVHAAGYDPPSVDATVCVVAAGTADAAAAGEAAVTSREMGPTVRRVDDVGVAHLGRVLDERTALAAADVLVVAAGREGALPTVVAGLVDTPVIGLPVSSGYGFGGDGEAALAGMLQSCTVLSTVNVDAGFVAGGQAALIARAIADGADGVATDSE
jgi:NCAIR mutase (PurE)-related protein